MIQAEPVTPSELTDLPIRSLALNDLRHCADLSEDRGWLREDHKWGLLLVAGDGYGIDAPDGNGLAAVCVVTRYSRSHMPIRSLPPSAWSSSPTGTRGRAWGAAS